MASNTNRTIVLKGSERGAYEEYVANAAITPGHLLYLLSTNKVAVHATAGGICTKWFACEDSLQGKTIDDAYAALDPVRVWKAVPGDWINALVAASAAAIVIGDYVCPSSDGTLKKWTGLTDNSGGSANTTLTTIPDIATAGGSTPTAAQVDTAVNADLVFIRNNFADLAAVLNLMKYGAMAIANEAVDNSGGGSVARLSVTII